MREPIRILHGTRVQDLLSEKGDGTYRLPSGFVLPKDLRNRATAYAYLVLLTVYVMRFADYVECEGGLLTVNEDGLERYRFEAGHEKRATRNAKALMQITRSRSGQQLLAALILAKHERGVVDPHEVLNQVMLSAAN